MHLFDNCYASQVMQHAEAKLQDIRANSSKESNQGAQQPTPLTKEVQSAAYTLLCAAQFLTVMTECAV